MEGVFFQLYNIQCLYVQLVLKTIDKKYPIEAAAVTIPVAIVRVSLGKCFPTSDTGTPIAVAPKAIPTKTPNAN